MDLIGNTYTTKVVDESAYLHHVTDQDGNRMEYRFYNGHRYIENVPKDCPKLIERIANLKCRDDDIFVATYPKSGLHWITNVAGMLASGTTEYTGTPPFLEMAENTDKLDAMKSPRTLSTHMSYDLLPRELTHGGKGKIINMSRNPKDVLISFYTFVQNLPYEPGYKGNFDGFLKYFLREDIVCDGWFEYYKEWDKLRKAYPERPILYLSYEEMKKDLYGHVKKISNFLGYEHSEEFLREVEEKCSFESMKKGAMKTSEDFKVVFPVYRKGEVGYWKHWLTVSQKELFDAVYAEKMLGIDATFQYD